MKIIISNFWKGHMALVLGDDFVTVKGIITLEDVVEELIGVRILLSLVK